MTRTQDTQRLGSADAERAMDAHMAGLADMGTGTHGLHRVAMRRFLDYVGCGRLGAGGELVLSGTVIEHWLVHLAKDSSDSNAAKQMQVVDRYLDRLVQTGSIVTNPLNELHRRLGNRGWVWIMQAARGPHPHQALRRLHVRPPAPGPLHLHTKRYVDLRRALGRVSKADERILSNLDHFLRSQGVRSAKSVGQEIIGRWLERMTCRPKQIRVRTGIAWRFFDYLRGKGVVKNNPVDAARQDAPRVPKSSFRPFIFTKEQVAQLLDAARKLPANHLFPLRADVCYTVFTLQYALGLRLGEAQHLGVEDIDLEQRILLIRQTKFHKSRYVPFGQRLARCLRRYLDARLQKLQPVRPYDPAFVALWRRPISQQALEDVFRRLLEVMGIRAVGSRTGPRTHDLRHSFAVHRLLRWYRQGVDVQSRLMHLSTFMGHIEPSSTQVYLTITTDLLAEASRRFYRRFGKPVVTEATS